MEPRQYTDKSDATQGTPPAPPSDGAAEDTARAMTRGSRPEDPRSGTSLAVPRAVLWTAVAVALAVGVALYFRYERAVAPLFGGGR